MRRTLPILLLAAASATATSQSTAPGVIYAEVTRDGADIRLPRDHGAHPDYRTEWWYFTGWLETPDGKPLGFQITFFRSRPAVGDANPSRFTARQILFAHAALSDPASGRLVHDQRLARAGFGIAEASTTAANVTLLDWSLRAAGDGFRARVPANGFTLDLAFAPTQPAMLNGDRGYSRKGPLPEQASYYYSMPHLTVTGAVRTRDGRERQVRGAAWLDREWSSTLLAPGAVGWDWAGINFDDGGALMVFQVRGRDGRALYAGGTLRRRDGSQVAFAPGDVRFIPRRRWRSPESGATYPVEADFLVRLPEGVRRFRLKPLFDAQELAGGAGMPTYWEGAVTTDGGRGYLELTGYAGALAM